MAKSKTDVFRPVMLVILILVVFAALGLGVAIGKNTFINPWYPAAGAAALGAISATTLWRLWPRLTGTGKVWINFLCQTVTAASILYGAFYTLNFACADPATLHTEKAVVARKYSKTHYRTRRISRRVYGRGAPYQVYHADVEFSSGRRHTLTLKPARYIKIHKGDTIGISLARGLFGIPVVKN